MNKQNYNRLKSGKLLRVFWLDIEGYINANFNKAKCAKTYTLGHVHCLKKMNNIEYAVIVTSAYEDGTGDCTAIPLGCIYQVDLIK